MEPGNAPYAPRATSYPRQKHDTFAFLPTFSISTLIKTNISKKSHNMTCYHETALPDYHYHLRFNIDHLPFRKKMSEFRFHTHMHAYHEGSGIKNQDRTPFSFMSSVIGHHFCHHFPRSNIYFFQFFVKSDIHFFSRFLEIGLHDPPLRSDFSPFPAFLRSDVSSI